MTSVLALWETGNDKPNPHIPNGALQVIWDSGLWKEDLLRLVRRHAKRLHQTRWSERSLFNLEKDYFVALYVLRKLKEAGKLSSEVASLRVPGRRHRTTGKRVTRLNWHRVDELYGFGRFTSVNFTQDYLSNQVIHSYVFMGTGDDGIDGVLFVSDRERNRHLNYVSLEATAGLLLAVVVDDVVHGEFRLRPGESDYKVRTAASIPALVKRLKDAGRELGLKRAIRPYLDQLAKRSAKARGLGR